MPYEPCFYCTKQGSTPPYYGDRTGTNVWRVAARTGTGDSAMAIGSGVVLISEGGAGELFLQPTPAKNKKVRSQQLRNGEAALITQNTDSADVWEVAREADTIHPTQKPVELARKAIKNSTRDGDIVLDLFHGSGSTTIGCEQLGRVCYAIEIDPQHVDAALRRWQTLTGKAATHATEKKTYEQIEKARAGKAKTR